jgi:hypothetical protein
LEGVLKVEKERVVGLSEELRKKELESDDISQFLERM